MKLKYTREWFAVKAGQNPRINLLLYFSVYTGRDEQISFLVMAHHYRFSLQVVKITFKFNLATALLNSQIRRRRFIFESSSSDNPFVLSRSLIYNRSFSNLGTHPTTLAWPSLWWARASLVLHTQGQAWNNRSARRHRHTIASVNTTLDTGANRPAYKHAIMQTRSPTYSISKPQFQPAIISNSFIADMS